MTKSTGQRKNHPPIVPGDKFNRLTAIRFFEKRSRIAHWLFRCDCGTERVMSGPHVKGGFTVSCGCAKKKPFVANKQCPRCKDFFVRASIGISYCDPCRKLYNSEQSKKDKTRRRESQIQRYENREVRITKMFLSIKGSARRRNLSFIVLETDIASLITKQDWKCARTGIPFDLVAGKGKRPFGPTVDRIDNDRGYEPGNIQVVCNMYNTAKMNFTDNDVLRFAYAIVERTT
jgi:hypothetical protein